jgi:hypothetical protein
MSIQHALYAAADAAGFVPSAVTVEPWQPGRIVKGVLPLRNRERVVAEATGAAGAVAPADKSADVLLFVDTQRPGNSVFAKLVEQHAPDVARSLVVEGLGRAHGMPWLSHMYCSASAPVGRRGVYIHASAGSVMLYPTFIHGGLYIVDISHFEVWVTALAWGVRACPAPVSELQALPALRN